jgi:hypothetical protein
MSPSDALAAWICGRLLPLGQRIIAGNGKGKVGHAYFKTTTECTTVRYLCLSSTCGSLNSFMMHVVLGELSVFVLLGGAACESAGQQYVPLTPFW